MKSAKTILTAMGLFILFSWQNGQFVFSQAHEEKFTMIKDQLLGNEVMIDFSLFVGAEGKEREMLDSFRKEGRKQYDASVYDTPGTSWYKDAFLSNFVFAFDRSFYEYGGGQRRFFKPGSREPVMEKRTIGYKIDEIINDGIKEFGGYDQIIIWVSYPRLGIDERNQFDLHIDMPGGLEGLRNAVDKAHERGVRVFIAYNPWDRETRFDSNADGESLAELAHAINADGIFLDTMASADTSFTNAIEKLNPNIVYSTEATPGRLEQLDQLSGGWQQLTNVHQPNYYTDRVPHPTRFCKYRWIEPRYSLRGDNRDAEILAPHVKYSFFHGYGYLVWENIFGWWNPISVNDRNLIKKCVFVLRQFKDAFHDMDWQPFVKTEIEGVYVNQWNDGNKTVYTVYNYTNKEVDDVILLTEKKKGVKIYDMWNGVEIEPTGIKNKFEIKCKLDPYGIGCLVIQSENQISPEFYKEPDFLVETNYRRSPSISDMKSNTVTSNWQFGDRKSFQGMVEVPGDVFTMNVCHNVHPFMEGACYGDVSTRHSKNHASETFFLKTYYIDKTEVTNAMYKAFLDSSHYIPGDLTNFLKHWVKSGKNIEKPWLWNYPDSLANHPVVWVSHDDARAYAQWYGKRLPTEEEWQYAAQGADLLNWPWGNEFDESKCNGNSESTMPVGSYTDGASPFGCLDMAGNVWEWNYKVWDDGHTRFTLLRGGSYFKTDGSLWYPSSGAQGCEVHEKMLLLYPGLDRCANIGFRCVAD